MPARNPPKNGRPWTPEKVRERIRLAKIVNRLERAALNELPAKGRGPNAPLTMLQLQAGVALLDRCLPRAQFVDVTHGGSITVIRRDPTRRDQGYKRRTHERVAGD